jgi:hypothetical protein
MARTTSDRLIVNSPYEEPAQHWRCERETRTFDLLQGRRPAGCRWPRAIPRPSTILAFSSSFPRSTSFARVWRRGGLRGIRA